MNTLYMNFKKPYVSNTPLESFPWLRPALFFVLLTARSVLVHASEVPAEAFCSCPSNKAEQQFKEKHLKLKTISSERELKKRK